MCSLLDCETTHYFDRLISHLSANNKGLFVFTEDLVCCVGRVDVCMNDMALPGALNDASTHRFAKDSE